MINRVSSRLGQHQADLPALHTHAAKQTIVASRLEGVAGGFQQDAIQLVARKVAGLSGDARRALDTAGGPQRRGTGTEDDDRDDACHQGYQEMFSSPKILAIRCCQVSSSCSR